MKKYAKSYIIIWAIIYAINRKRIAKINAILKSKQEN